MKFDRNTVLGFVILAALFFGYFYFTNKQQSDLRKQKLEEAKILQAKEDSIRLVNQPLQDSLNKIRDSLNKTNPAIIFRDTVQQTEQLVIVQNDFLRITFTTK